MSPRAGLALRIAVFSNAMMLFGFLYEEVVDVPNLMGSRAREAQALWGPYHWFSNPTYYFGLAGMAGLFSLLFLWLKRRELSSADRARLLVAIAGHAATAVLTVIAVTNINNHLYFGPPIGDPARVRLLAVTWFVLNAARIAATALTTTRLIGISRSLTPGR